MPSSALSVFLLIAVSIPTLFLLFVVYLWVRYSPIVSRIFEEAPPFRPLRVEPSFDGQDVRFPTADGLTLAGTYLAHRGPSRAGVVVFCHEFLGDRGSVGPYADSLRDLGFDLFAFDFRNHGQSDSQPGYSPLQWVCSGSAVVVQRRCASPAATREFGAWPPMGRSRREERSLLM